MKKLESVEEEISQLQSDQSLSNHKFQRLKKKPQLRIHSSYIYSNASQLDLYVEEKKTMKKRSSIFDKAEILQSLHRSQQSSVLSRSMSPQKKDSSPRAKSQFNFNIYSHDKQVLKKMLNQHLLSIHGIFSQEKKLVRIRKKLVELQGLLDMH